MLARVPSGMPTGAVRVQMNAEVSPEAKTAWEAYAAQHGLFLTHVLEAVGRRLAAARPVSLDDPELIAEARAIFAERSAERRRSRKKVD